jgi:hypothetical protein
MSGNLLPDSHLPADMVYHYKGAYTLIIFIVAFLKTGRTATVFTTDPPHVGEWSTRERLYIFVTYFTT